MITVLGVDELLTGLQKAQEEIQKHAVEGVDLALAECQYDLRNGCPYRSGKMRGSLSKDPASLQGDVVFGQVGFDEDECNYSRWVVYGHRTRSGSIVPPNPFMEAAALRAERYFPEIMRG